MTVALLNTTPIVEKLVNRLTGKRGDTLYVGAAADGSTADVVILDDSVSERYDAAEAKRFGRYSLFVGSRFETMPEGYDAFLAKPFLPDELGRALDGAELALSASAAQSDVFDADEAAASWEAQGETVEAAPERPIFDRSEIDELKQLLDAVEQDEDPEETAQQLKAAMRQLGVDDWEYSDAEEVLYDAEAPAAYVPEAAGPVETAEAVESAEEPDAPEASAEAETAPAEASAEAFGEIDLHGRGVEALQDLMAILSDESVAKAFKAIGVRVDITFGEKS